MKKFLILTLVLVAILLTMDYLYYYSGSLFLPAEGEPEFFSMAANQQMYLDSGSGMEPFSLRGINLGLGKPGYFATDMKITKEEYLRWFRQIQDLGANVIRTYTIASPVFYDAFYEYNTESPTPLYLIQGVWVDDYLINSTHSAIDREFYRPFLKSCKKMVDVIHGRAKLTSPNALLAMHYDKDISPWVYGYILGVEWESNLVGFTNQYTDQLPQYEGTYLRTEDASNFEIFLASAGDQVLSYETRKYGTQRVFAFSNWATTDPFTYPSAIAGYFKKYSSVDVEHIHCTDAFAPGQFASYHVYPYYPDYYHLLPVHSENTYLQYLTSLNRHHKMPVVISEFGVPSSRGMACRETGLGRNQGFMSETQQGEALVSMYEDVMNAGSAGAIAFTWQDEWFKRTWNTMAGVDLTCTPSWSDYQTNEQYFGLLAFDPGEEKSICYVDGDRSDWGPEDVIGTQNGLQLSAQYDEKYLYFMADSETGQIPSPLYFAFDVTPASGSDVSREPAVTMSGNADFILQLDGDQSRLLVQERYDMLHALHKGLLSPDQSFWGNPPATNSHNFCPILLLLQEDSYYQKSSTGLPDRPISFWQFNPYSEMQYSIMATYETGKLRYGNGNPESEDFDSLADFCAGDGFVEIRIPWQLLNFADPSNMKIHDDYYIKHGVEYLRIDHISVGAGDGSQTIELHEFPLKPLGKKPEYHERLKKSYYILQDYWQSHP